MSNFLGESRECSVLHGSLWELACQRCRHRVLTGICAEAIAGKPAPTEMDCPQGLDLCPTSWGSPENAVFCTDPCGSWLANDAGSAYSRASSLKLSQACSHRMDCPQGLDLCPTSWGSPENAVFCTDPCGSWLANDAGSAYSRASALKLSQAKPASHRERSARKMER